MWKTVKRLIRLSLLERRRLCVATMCQTLASAAEVGIGFGIKLIYDAITATPPRSVVPGPLLVFLVSAGVRVCSGEVATHLFAAVSDRLQARLRSEHHAGMRNLAALRSEASTTADALSALTTHATTASKGAAVLWRDIFGSTFHVALLAGIFFARYGTVSFLAVVVIAAATLSPLWFGKRLRKLSRQSRAAADRLLSRIQESLAGAHEILAFSAEDWDQERVSAASSDAREAHEHLDRWQRLAGGVSFGSYWLGISLAYLFGAKLVAAGRITAGDCVAFVWFCNLLNQPVSRLSHAHSELQGVLVALERLEDLGRLSGEVLPEPDLVLREEFDSIAFDNVSFRYPSGTQALDGVSFTIRRGEHVAIVGENGSGKTTIVRLLLALHQPTQGSIRLNGVDCGAAASRALRQYTGIVFQDAFLFDTTLFENIRLGDSRATEPDVWSALAYSHSEAFVQRVPGGLYATAGDRGKKLSGGERQRIAICRALLKDPELLVLDEPTASVDPVADRQVLETILQRRRNRAVLVITHKLTNMEWYDRVLVMHRGRLVAAGSHAQLTSGCRLYRDLCHRDGAATSFGGSDAVQHFESC